MNKPIKLFVLSLLSFATVSCGGIQPIQTEFEVKTKEIYALYQEQGGEQTYEEWLSSITGPQGEKGDTGASGSDGADGLTPHIENGFWYLGDFNTYVLATGAQGEKGDTGEAGQNGKSAYDIATENGFVGSEEEWLESLKGKDGKSAYEIYIEKHQDYSKSEEEWLDDLVNGRLADKTKVTVSFDSNGGSEVESIVTTKGSLINRPINPIFENHGFIGWYTSDGEQWVFKGCTVEENITLYALWQNNSYTISYHLDGGDNSYDNPSCYTFGESVLLKNPSREYSVFDGWFTDPEYQNQITSISSLTTGDIDLYAKFTYNSYTLTFDTGYDTIKKDPLTLSYKSDLGDISLTKTDMIFRGWYEDNGYLIPFTATTMPSANKVLYAKWETKKFSVKITNSGYFDDGSITPAISISFGSYSASGYASPQTFNVDYGTAMYCSGDELYVDGVLQAHKYYEIRCNIQISFADKNTFCKKTYIKTISNIPINK